MPLARSRVTGTMAMAKAAAHLPNLHGTSLASPERWHTSAA